VSLYLPKSTVAVIHKVQNDHRHPGLQLDKFSIPGDQQAQKEALDQVSKIQGDPGFLASLSERRQRALQSLPGAKAFRCRTTGPLTLHLARASALENAGICLHPLYGFAYLPGSGLKGLARAFAETVWLATQRSQAEAWRRIEEVFGWAPASDRGKDWKPAGIPERPKDDSARVGAVVFHDAWPTAWPRLTVDIVNNHHPNYYQSTDGDSPPGDWEDPVPVYFLAVKPGATFTFPLSKRRDDVADDLLDLARRWLLGGLCHLGAGAKTNAGYGAFEPVNAADASLLADVDGTWQAATSGTMAKHAVFETTVSLVAPGFFAGAEQFGSAAGETCDLRPATLRGHLRWWWRTMHAGFLDVKTLRALEAAIWGDTHAGGAVRIVVEQVDRQGKPATAQIYDKASRAKFDNQQKRSELGIPDCDPHKTTQGLWYASYGMDERKPCQRWVLEPPASWRLRLIARSTRFFTNRADAADAGRSSAGRSIRAEHVLDEAKAALWLLCHFGAVGSKARKGFGSLSASGLDEWTRKKCRDAARQLREALGLGYSCEPTRAHSSSLEQLLDPVEVAFSWPDVWQVLDQVGFAYQAFAKKYKHRREKMALGLPRRMDYRRAKGEFNPRPPVRIEGRHASPVHIHVARSDGGWLVRAAAFPASHLPCLSKSTEFLKEFLEEFRNDLKRRASKSPPSRPPRDQHAQPPRPAPAHAGAASPRPGDRVRAVLLEERTKKGGWKAKHDASGMSGPIQNSADVPADARPGDTVDLIVMSVDRHEIGFRYPTPADEQRARGARRKPGGSPGGRR